MDWMEIIMIVLIALEAILRQIPTEKDNSLVNWLLKVLDWILPNRGRNKAQFRVKSERVDKNE